MKHVKCVRRGKQTIAPPLINFPHFSRPRRVKLLSCQGFWNLMGVCSPESSAYPVSEP